MGATNGLWEIGDIPVKSLSKEALKSNSNFRHHGQMEKQRWEESEKRREEERSEKRKNQKKEDACARKCRKVAKHSVWCLWSLKRRVQEPFGEMRAEKLHAVVEPSTFSRQNARNQFPWAVLEVEMSKKCTRLLREAHVGVNIYKAPQVWITFGRWDVEKVQGVREAHVEIKMYKTPQGRSTFGSWEVKNVHSDVARSTFQSQKC